MSGSCKLFLVELDNQEATITTEMLILRQKLDNENYTVHKETIDSLLDEQIAWYDRVNTRGEFEFPLDIPSNASRLRFFVRFRLLAANLVGS